MSALTRALVLVLGAPGRLVTEALLSVAGANRAVLELAPRDRVKQASLGGALLTTAGLAAVSACVASQMAFGMPWRWAVVGAAVWGLAILNLDRWLVVSSPRQATRFATTLMALPRLALAVVIGLVVSTPLTLQIFDAEIQTQVQRDHQEARQGFEERIIADPRYAGIPDLQAEIDDLETQATEAAAPADAVAANPQVVALQDALAAKDAEYTRADEAVACELEGRCGSGQAGAGPAFELKVATRDRLRQERDDLRTQLAETRSSLLASTEAAASSSAGARTARLGDLHVALDAATTARADEVAEFDAAVAEDDGLLARLGALESLSEEEPAMGAAHDALFLFLTLLECLPILFKTMLSLGRPSLYDEVVAMQDSRAKSALRWRQKAAEAEVRLAAEAAIAATTAHETSRREAEVKAAELVLAAQVSLTRVAVTRWKKQQEKLIDDDVDAFVTTSPAGLRAARREQELPPLSRSRHVGPVRDVAPASRAALDAATSALVATRPDPPVPAGVVPVPRPRVSLDKPYATTTWRVVPVSLEKAPRERVDAVI